MHEPTDWSVVARADDQQIKRRAVQRQLLHRVAIYGARLDAGRRDPPARIIHELIDGAVDRLRAPMDPYVEARRPGRPARDRVTPLGRRGRRRARHHRRGAHARRPLPEMGVPRPANENGAAPSHPTVQPRLTRLQQEHEMFRNVLVGVDAHGVGRDAIALARMLLANGGELTLAHIFSGQPHIRRGSNADHDVVEREHALELLENTRREADARARLRWRRSSSVGRGLHGRGRAWREGFGARGCSLPTYAFVAGSARIDHRSMSSSTARASGSRRSAASQTPSTATRSRSWRCTARRLICWSSARATTGRSAGSCTGASRIKSRAALGAPRCDSLALHPRHRRPQEAIEDRESRFAVPRAGPASPPRRWSAGPST